MAVAVEPGSAADSFLESGPHRKKNAVKAFAAGQDTGRSGRLDRLQRPLVGLVGEVRAEPPLRLGLRQALARGVRLDLVAADPADGEVARLRVVEVDTADGGGGGNGEGL